MNIQLHTTITLRESSRWLSTATAPTVTATVTGKRVNCLGGTTYMIEFTSHKLLNGKPVQVSRLLTDRELVARNAQIVKKSRKQTPRKVARSGKRAA